MKRISIVLIAIFINLMAIAQKVVPERIYSFATVRKPVEWYKDQSVVWKAQVDKEPKNAYAWYNYYRATRNYVRLNESDKRSEYEKWMELNKLLDDMGKKVPNTFEYNLCKWMNGGNNFELFPYLEKAHQLGPDRPELFSDMLGWGEIKGNEQLKEEYAEKWYRSGEMSPGFLYYNYNVLAGLKPNAILITAGDNDTYPIWILQAAKGVRKDVTILNTSLLYIKEYREMIFKKLGVKELDYDISYDTTLVVWSKAQKKHNRDILEALVSNSQNRPVYIGVTACKENYDFADSSLYLTGLAYEYSKRSFDNMAVLKRNFEQVYALDYLDKYFYNDRSDGMVKMINGNYIIPLIKLYEHYQLSGESQKAEHVKLLCLEIASGTDQEKEAINYFK